MMISIRKNNHVFFASSRSCADEKFKKKTEIHIVQYDQIKKLNK